MHFEHYHFSRLNYLSRRELVSGLPVVEILIMFVRLVNWERNIENHFLLDKSWRARKLLKIVHSDLCTIDVPTHGGSKYFITFIHDFSIKTWVYFLKQKSEACDVFKSFKAYVENQSDCKIKILITDKGQEYLACTDLFEQHGISIN